MWLSKEITLWNPHYKAAFSIVWRTSQLCRNTLAARLGAHGFGLFRVQGLLWVDISGVFNIKIAGYDPF